MTTEQQRKMLEAAAKACGLIVIGYQGDGLLIASDGCRSGYLWNPLSNPADTAEMCAKLIIGTEWCAESSRVVCFSRGRHRSSSFADHNNDREAAWRHAATMVAAKTQGWKE